MTVTFKPEDLQNFTGTETYYKSNPLIGDIFHTDGIQHIATNGGAWMVDLIISHQFTKRVRACEFQVWKFIVNAGDSSCRVTCEDGMRDYDRNAPLVTQDVQFTDLPFNVELFLEYGSLDGVRPAQVILLPSEH